MRGQSFRPTAPGNRLRLSLFLTLSLGLFGTAREAEAQRAWPLHTGRSTLPQLQQQAESAAPLSQGDAPPRFTVVPIGVVAGRNSTFVPFSRSVNNEGAVAGYSYNVGRRFLTAIPFVWHRGTLHVLPLPDGSRGAFAFGINDRGQVVGAGNHLDPTGQSVTQSAVIWDHGNVVDVANRLANASSSFTSDINNEGTAVGAYIAADTGAEVPFVLHRGELIVLPLVPRLTAMGLTGAEPGRINDSGEIAGEQFNADGSVSVPVVWRLDEEQYTVRSLGGFGGTFGQAVGINELGFIAGQSNLVGDAHSHALLWRGRLRDLGVLPGDTDSRAFDINDEGQIVGISSSTATIRTFLWERGKMMDLHDLVPSTTAPFNDNVGQINDRGEVAVVSMDATGKESAFLLVPVDEDR